MRLKFKSKPPKPTGEIVNKFKFSTGEIGRSGKIIKKFKFLTGEIINKFKFLTGEIVKKFKFLTRGIGNKFKFSTGEIGRSGEIVKFFKFLTDNAMKLIENKSVVLSWVYLQPFCSTFFSYFTLLFVFGRRSRSRTIQKVEKRVLTSRRLWRGWGAVIIFDDFWKF